MVKIMIDAGHGPDTAGKRSPDGTLKEFMFNRAVAELVGQYLNKDGLHVSLAHDPDRDVPLAERVAKAHTFKADLFVSIHANAFGTTWNDAAGIETYVYPSAGSETQALAALVQQSLIIACNGKNRGVKKADFFVLRETAMPAILIECGFMTNRQEMALLMNNQYRVQCARAIAFAVSAWVYRQRK